MRLIKYVCAIVLAGGVSANVLAAQDAGSGPTEGATSKDDAGSGPTQGAKSNGGSQAKTVSPARDAGSGPTTGSTSANDAGSGPTQGARPSHIRASGLHSDIPLRRAASKAAPQMSAYRNLTTDAQDHKLARLVWPWQVSHTPSSVCPTSSRSEQQAERARPRSMLVGLLLRSARGRTYDAWRVATAQGRTYREACGLEWRGGYGVRQAEYQPSATRSMAVGWTGSQDMSLDSGAWESRTRSW